MSRDECEALKALGTFQAVGGNEVLIELAQDVTSAAHVAHHARIVAHNATLRRLIAEATGVIEEAFSTQADEQAVRALLDESEHRIFSIARSGGQSSAESIRGILAETFERLEAKSKHELTGLNTGYYELNDKLCGLNRGDLIILAARPAMGKTALALNLIENAALSWAHHAFNDEEFNVAALHALYLALFAVATDDTRPRIERCLDDTGRRLAASLEPATDQTTRRTA
jgi:replicative DNA helicase